MKSLIVYYSRTGTTKKVADKLADKLKADKEEIIDLKNRKGAVGYIIGGKDAMTKKLTKINELKKNPENYDLLIIGTPVWAFTMAPAIRTFLIKIKDYNKKIALFFTAGSSGMKKTLTQMKELLPKSKLTATLALTTSEVVNKGYDKKLDIFIKNLK